MKSLLKHTWIAALVAAALLASPRAQAQAPASGDSKTVAVFSIAPIDKVLGDIDHLAKTAGGAAEDAGRMVALMAGPYTAALDRTKPIGVIVSFEDDQPVVLGFLPTKDITPLLAALKDSIGEPKDAGGGIQQIGDGPAAAYIKQEAAHAFIARDPKHLASLPKDPQALLGGLEKTYTIAARLNVRNIPKKFKDQWVAEMKAGFEAASMSDDDPAQREAVESLGRNALTQLTSLIEDSDQVTIGWAVDAKAKTTYTDILYTAIPNTKLAGQMAALKNSKTNFAGFMLDDAALTMNAASQITDKDQIAQATAMLDTFRDTMLKELKKDTGADEDERKIAEELLTTLMDVLKATVATGKSDAGAVAVVGPKDFSLAFGTFLADAPKLEGALKKAVKFAQEKKSGDFEGVEVKFDQSAHGGVRMHNFKIPIPEEKAQAIFGEKLNVTLGVGDKSIYIAAGTKADETLKRVIDKSAAEPNKAIQPMLMNISIGPFLKFANSVEENPFVKSAAAEADKVKGNDRIRIHVKAIDNGEHLRFEVEEGVFKAIGQAAAAASNPEQDAF